MKNEQKASIKLMSYAAITIPKFNFNSNQIKIIVKGEQVEYVEHANYLFYRKSQGI